jgi:hypothetical protein
VTVARVELRNNLQKLRRAVTVRGLSERQGRERWRTAVETGKSVITTGKWAATVGSIARRAQSRARRQGQRRTAKVSASNSNPFSVHIYSSYEVLTFASVGLAPTEHISLSLSFSAHAEARYPPHLFPCLRFTVHLAMPSAKLGAEWIASPFS